MLFDVLKQYGLSTVAEASASIPIIIQSFDINGLLAMAKLTDLPLVYLLNDQHVYDYSEVSQQVHGVGPPNAWIMQTMSDTGDANSDYSAYIKQMHDLDLAVHPYVDQDDMLTDGNTVYEEAEMFVNKGVDGIFCEFPHT